MGIDGVFHIVDTPVLRALINIRIRLRGIHQRETYGIVVGLVRSIFTIFQDGDTVIVGSVGKVDPHPSWYFKLYFVVVGTLNGGGVEAIGSIFVGGSGREGSLETYLFRLPVNFIGDFYPLAAFSGRQADELGNLRVLAFFSYLQCHAHGSLLGNFYRHLFVHEIERRILTVVPVHVPGRPLRRTLLLKLERSRFSKDFFQRFLIENAGDISVGIDFYREIAIFNRLVFHRKGRRDGGFSRFLYIVNCQSDRWQLSQEDDLQFIRIF